MMELRVEKEAFLGGRVKDRGFLGESCLAWPSQ